MCKSKHPKYIFFKLTKQLLLLKITQWSKRKYEFAVVDSYSPAIAIFFVKLCFEYDSIFAPLSYSFHTDAIFYDLAL